MNKHTGCTKAFSQLSRAWYGKDQLQTEDITDSFSIGFYDLDGGGTTGEFTINWEELTSHQVPLLRCYDDAWSALFNFKDLLESLASNDDKNISPDDLRGILLNLGFKDITKTEQAACNAT